ncbi:2126_t:CDS:2 [Paraglomus occultum]|uniref:Phospholipid scramblase n=1 Tax=Paraglomus occultum TaxID=144539 RepID=A0A9N8ZEC3_9GLOM|nr:2126_t:CDS:2 [Paraglomus occultum]
MQSIFTRVCREPLHFTRKQLSNYNVHIRPAVPAISTLIRSHSSVKSPAEFGTVKVRNEDTDLNKSGSAYYFPSTKTSVTLPHNRADVLSSTSPAAMILANSALVVTRQLEMLNVFLGFEQANKYAILDPSGHNVGYIAEQQTSFTSLLLRQAFRTHRSFTAVVMDVNGNVTLKLWRPFAWINSRLFVSTAEDEPIGEVQQQWHFWRRRYNLFVKQRQFAKIDGGFWTWNFTLENERGGVLGKVDRNFRGFGREIFTDTGQYVIRMDATEGQVREMTLDERAVTLAAAVSIDFDYFSRHSSHGAIFPMEFFSQEDELQEDSAETENRHEDQVEELDESNETNSWFGTWDDGGDD